jgi:hypothetical protein
VVVVIAWVYQCVGKEPGQMQELAEADGKQWLGRKKLLASNCFSELVKQVKANYTRVLWQDNQQKKLVLRNKSVTYLTGWLTSNLLSTTALSPLPIKTEM